ncbi:putative membrane metallo-endopeptidase-like 1 [Penaeus vannamei]|uniref:Putative membrane metallo-endopeptidase-like 1 n=1 Tax=Penaeus vannamei TaxID=6689 RepID=A0A3R7M813_PENVA|nr:putative membrane metallo-endopeptidase-like 1 [Penaeus vannamei]
MVSTKWTKLASTSTPSTPLARNIADNAGIKIAYQAYKKWAEKNEEQVTVPYVNLTHDQLFFLNFGQIWCENNRPEAMLTKIRSGQHSPNKFRVIGTLSNSEDFSRAYNCPVGSRMNPERKCKVW